MYYKANTTDKSFLDSLLFKYEKENEKLDSLEFGYSLNSSNPVAKFFRQLAVDSVEITMNYTRRDDPENIEKTDISEVVVAALFRWASFPWNEYLKTTFAFGEGLSYATQITADERRSLPQDKDGSRLLNFLAVEATVSLPRYQQLELFTRLHHRSSVGGLFGDHAYGSNAVGAGLRFWF